MDNTYDQSDPKSILAFSQQLLGKSLSDFMSYPESLSANKHTKGSLGKLLEVNFFEINPPDDHSPDFALAGVELKTTGVRVKKDAATGAQIYVAKERLSLTMIDYIGVVKELWKQSTVLEKCRLMLMVFYLYEREVAVTSRKFVMPPFLWEFPELDLEIIRTDWNFIVEKIKDGKAHELSEGDTMYLGACRKGNDKVPHRQQPYSDILCLSRAFCLKQNYVTLMIAAKGNAVPTESLFEEEATVMPIQDLITKRLSGFIGMDVTSIATQLGFPLEQQSKQLLRLLSSYMLGVHTDYITEFEKAEVSVKTIRLSSKGVPKESMSFAGFKSADLVSQEWEESKFNEELERRKYLLMVFQYDDDGVLRFLKGKFWNMPWDDRQEARRVWEETKRRIMNYRAHELPLSDFSSVAHVRPKARDKYDVDVTPLGQEITKKCFWLNASYIANIAKS